MAFIVTGEAWLSAMMSSFGLPSGNSVTRVTVCGAKAGAGLSGFEPVDLDRLLDMSSPFGEAEIGADDEIGL